MTVMESQKQQRSKPRKRWRAILAICLGIALCVMLAVSLFSDWGHALVSEAALKASLSNLGILGPFALVGIMTLAIVVSPIPSGPIAMAAGALYGGMWGAIFSIIGAELGACMAFCAVRYLGHDAIRRSENRLAKYIAKPRSQTALMAVVFASRLIPFVSFDLVSYAAGATNLSFLRFAAATLLGIVPISFALAGLGAGMSYSDPNLLVYITIASGITLLPIIASWIWSKKKSAD